MTGENIIRRDTIRREFRQYNGSSCVTERDVGSLDAPDVILSGSHRRYESEYYTGPIPSLELRKGA